MSGRNAPRNINLRQENRKINSEEKLVNYIKTQLGHPLITVDVTEDQILQAIDDTFLKFSDWVWDAQQNQVFVIQSSGVQDYILDPRVKSIYGISIADGLSGYGTGGGGIWGGIPLGSIMPPLYVPATDFQGNASTLMQHGSFFGGSATGTAGGVAGGPFTSKNGSGNAVEAAWASMVDMQTNQNMFGPNVSFDFNASNHTLRIFDNVSGAIAIEAALDYIPNPEYDDAYGHPWLKAYALNLVKRIWGQNVGKYSSPLVGGATINFDRLISEAQQEIDKLEEQLMQGSEAMGMFSG